MLEPAVPVLYRAADRVPLFRNCTVPVGGAPLLCVFTTAVRVTLVPKCGCHGRAERVVTVAAAVIASSPRAALDL